MRNRNNMPKPKEIIDYWADRLVDMGIEEFPVTWESCFVCGAITRLERSHILALSDGGTNKVDNLHLLCRHCHDESESLSGQGYWRWYVKKRKEEFIHPLIRMQRKIEAVIPQDTTIDEILGKLETMPPGYRRFNFIWSVIDEGYKKMGAEAGMGNISLPQPTDSDLLKIYSRLYPDALD